MRSIQVDKQSDSEATRNRATFALKLDAVDIDSQATRTDAPEERRWQGVEGACREPLKCQGFSHWSCSIGFVDRTNEGVDGQNMNLERDDPLNQTLRRGADARTYSNTFVPCLGPSVTSRARPDVEAQILGVFLDQHLPKDWDLGADPFRKLWDSRIPVLYPMAFFVVEGL